ncbi:hypothetical protein TcWFU_001759 [Taenia crassiceps]|uniref:Uncharacterized protein n=1 Tax=Taenia crassiceps TaxID=6207 RepID=A0ABR4Q1U3_9CEST
MHGCKGFLLRKYFAEEAELSFVLSKCVDVTWVPPWRRTRICLASADEGVSLSCCGRRRDGRRRRPSWRPAELQVWVAELSPTFACLPSVCVGVAAVLFLCICKRIAPK